MNAPKVTFEKELSRPEIVFAAAGTPGSGRAFFGGSDFVVRAIDFQPKTPTVTDLGRHDSYVTGLAIAGRHLVSGGYDGQLIWWDVESGSKIRSLDAHRKWIRRVAATPDGRVVASVGDDMVGRLWDAGTGRLLHELRGHEEQTPHHYPSMLHACGISDDGRFVATGDKVGRVNVWAIDSGERVATLEAPVFYTWDPVRRRHSIGGIRALAFSPDGNHLAVGGIGQVGNIDHLDSKPRIQIFDWRQGKRIGDVQGEGRGMVERLVFHPGGDWLLGVGGHSNGFLFFCAPDGSKPLGQVKTTMYLHDLAPDDARTTFFSAGHHNVARLRLAPASAG